MNVGVEYIFCIIQVRMAEEITEQLNIVFDGISAGTPTATTVSQLIAVGAPLAAVMAATVGKGFSDRPHDMTAELRTAVAAVETAIRDADDEYARLVGSAMSLMLESDDLEATVAEKSRLRAGFVFLPWHDVPGGWWLLATADPEFKAAVRAHWACLHTGSDWPDPSDRVWSCLQMFMRSSHTPIEAAYSEAQFFPDFGLAAMVRRAMVCAILTLDRDLLLRNMPIAEIARALADHLRIVLVLPPVII